MRYASLLAALAGLGLAACGGPASPDAQASAAAPATAASAPPAAPSGWVAADLSTTPAKLPLVVQAPAGYTVERSPLGDVELASEKATFDVDDVTDLGAAVLRDKREEVKTNSGMVFEKFVLEQPDGFIARLGGGNYLPLRLVKVGGRTYQFSVIPLNALPSEAEARQLYDLAGQARTK